MAASKQVSTLTLPQCSPTSVGLTQARPNYQGWRGIQSAISHPSREMGWLDRLTSALIMTEAFSGHLSKKFFVS